MIGGLPYGVRKVVELGRALASEPKLLLLDEPASGLSVEETQDMAFWIEDIQTQMGISVMMVEHDMGLVSAVSGRVMALSDGKELGHRHCRRSAIASRRDRGLSGHWRDFQDRDIPHMSKTPPTKRRFADRQPRELLRPHHGHSRR